MSTSKLVFLGLFAIMIAITIGYEALYVWPKTRPVQNCEGRGGWWDEKDRQCLTPMPIYTFTHRAPGAPQPKDLVERPVPAPAQP
jgi:hypothetical protein